MKENRSFDLRELSAARANLLGLATLWIVLFHSYHLDFLQSSLLTRLHLAGLMNRLKEIGNCGVDLFLFASGLGLYYSLSQLFEKQRDHVLSTFWRRRFSRILPPLLIVSVLYYSITGVKSLSDWLGKVFLYGFFISGMEGSRYWYFALLIPLYLLFPLIFRGISRRRGGWFGLGLILLSVAGAMLLRTFTPVFYNRVEILLSRVPVFLLGACFGKLSWERTKIPAWLAALMVPVSAGLFLLISFTPVSHAFLRRYAYFFLTSSLVISHAWLVSMFHRHGPVYRAVSWLGTLSMEIYLIYEILYLADPPLFPSPEATGMVYALAVFAMTLMLSLALKLLLNFTRRKAEKRRANART